jgi:hypothetical protein
MASRFRSWRKRFGIAAPKVLVRTHWPWYFRWFGVALLLAFSAAVAVWMYDAGRRFAGFDSREIDRELAATRGELGKLREELEQLRAVANTADSKVSIERTAQQKLAQQIRGLEQENARLREELAIFESMLSSDAAGAAPLSILRFKVEPEGLAGEFRYHVLLLASGPRRGKEFLGRLELEVSLTEGGRSAMIAIPESGAVDAPSGAPFRLAFKHFQRATGSFHVRPGAKIVSVQLRVFESGFREPKVTKTVAPG